MKIAVNRKHLDDALKRACSLAKGNHIAALGWVRLEADDDFVLLSATDLDLTVHLRVPALVQDPGAIAVEALRLSALTGAETGEEIALEAVDRALIIRAKVESRVPLQDLDSFPTLPELRGIGAEFPRRALLDALAAAMPYVPRESEKGMRWAAGYALLREESGLLGLWAMDSHKAVHLESLCEAPGGFSAFISRRACHLLQGSSGEEIGVFCEDFHTGFRTEGVTVIGRNPEEGPPDFSKVFAGWDGAPSLRLTQEQVATIRPAVRVLDALIDNSKMSAPLWATFEGGRLTLSRKNDYAQGVWTLDDIDANGSSEVAMRYATIYPSCFETALGTLSESVGDVTISFLANGIRLTAGNDASVLLSAYTG